jgi:hypothetical protein
MSVHRELQQKLLISPLMGLRERQIKTSSNRDAGRIIKTGDSEPI